MKCIVNGIVSSSTALRREPAKIGVIRPFLSDSTPNIGLVIIIVAICAVRITPAMKASNFATSIVYPTMKNSKAPNV